MEPCGQLTWESKEVDYVPCKHCATSRDNGSRNHGLPSRPERQPSPPVAHRWCGRSLVGAHHLQVQSKRGAPRRVSAAHGEDPTIQHRHDLACASPCRRVWATHAPKPKQSPRANAYLGEDRRCGVVVLGNRATAVIDRAARTRGTEVLRITAERRFLETILGGHKKHGTAPAFQEPTSMARTNDPSFFTLC